MTGVKGTSNLYNFSNIRYGEPPIGDLRFAKPVAPKGRNVTIDKGDVGRICPQAIAAWEVYTSFTGPDFLSGKISTLTDDHKHALHEPSDLKIVIDPRETEDCLFLDVVTPVETFDSPVKKLAPVIFWLSGGGYTTGEKGWFDPAGLIKASYASSPEGLVFVSANYRLGALGWLAGTKLDPGNDANRPANAALYDQRLALEWIQENIHQFGGDPTRVTIMGESAGGASIYHHLTAFGGKDKTTLFQRAIPQSTGWVHIANEKLENDVIDKFLALAKVPDLKAARKLSTEEVQEANRLLISNSAWGTSTTGPFVDGLYVPENPDKLFAEGRHIQKVDVLIGFNEDEGLIFTSPESNDNAGYRKFLESTYSNASPETLDHIETKLYPPVFDGSYGYTNQTGRASITKAESEFTCKYGFLQAAYGNRAKSYRFNVYPGLHGSEMHYTFYNGPKRNPEVDEAIAVGFQELLTSFVAIGNATSLAAPQGVPVYGEERRMLYIGNEGFGITTDATVPERCKFWQSGIYLTSKAPSMHHNHAVTMLKTLTRLKSFTMSLASRRYAAKFFYARRPVHETLCHVLHVAKPSPKKQPPVIGYAYYKDINRERQRRFTPRLHPKSDINHPVERLCRLYLRKVTPDNWSDDPYIVCLLLALAQAQSIKQREEKPETFPVRLFLVVDGDKNYAHVFQADVDAHILKALDEPTLDLNGVAWPRITHTKVALQSYLTLPGRIVAELLGSYMEEKAEKRKYEDDAEAPMKRVKTTL
ncbi:hypothetical protein HZS61_010871 [Fusarium oxysporum f. sp. conglutinans]|uniref:Carboxylesterase type B domain-containing protein n=1 Tax=Fusarium oxysporum f. sp. conglutinans TaxID=100902 RepID=A0A8H6LNF2_FUSOX|nr:hypothetical protein HZS61_010871 [Fusarium oxysporum f. sp. conglutinans]